MRLHESPFLGIKKGKQIIEVRLNDNKRKCVRIGDTIVFSLRSNMDEKIKVKVLDLLKYDSFEELFENISLSDWNAAGWSMEQVVAACRKYYSKEDEELFGVLGIGIELID